MRVAQIDESRSSRGVAVAPSTNTDTPLDRRRRVDPRIYNRRFGKALRFLFTLQQASSRHVTPANSKNIQLGSLNTINMISFPYRWLTFWREYSTPELTDWTFLPLRLKQGRLLGS
jgi:hypothetical protein